MSTPSPASLSRLAIIRLAIPIIVANAAVPLLGLVDTAVIGHTGTAVSLGAIALGSLIFSFVYWGFGFLRMSTSGFIAQAAGAGNTIEVNVAFARALLLSLAIGLILVVAQYFISLAALHLLTGSAAVEQQVSLYFATRIWGAPATLGTYVLTGLFIGLGQTRKLLWLQLVLNGLNLMLDVIFVVGFGWGVYGIALGTVIAEWLSFMLGLWLVCKLLSITPRMIIKHMPWTQILQHDALRNTLRVNADIMWRTLFLLAGFGWFTNQGAQFGDITLASNHILLQFISFSAFFLDGYAFAVEALVGTALGARNRPLFDSVIRHSTEVAGLTALALMLVILLLGPAAINALTPLPTIQQETRAYLPYAAVYVLLSFIAFQLDGIFIGATRGREMRDASFLSLLVFIGIGWVLTTTYGNQGLWLAFILFVVVRALSLGVYLPRLRRTLAK